MAGYLEQFADAEAFVRRQICANRGTENAVMRDDLIKLAEQNGIKVKSTMTKDEIYLQLRERLNLESIIEICEHIGVRSINMQQRFGIPHTEVKKLERSGFLKASGYEEIRLYGKYRQVPLYNPVQVFELTREAIDSELKQLSERKRRKEV